MPQLKKQIDLDEDDILWFYQQYGSNASLSWLLGLLLHEFRKACTSTPTDYAAIGAAAVKQILEDDGS